ncbi:hypothetical protein HYS31_07585 [Candidatus Woesearchaeota archaeon]|nr:hypothetical protein [Candidatus Woesearchaeota archaeon]
MDLKPSLEKLQKDDDFRKWKKKAKNTYFSYAFKIPQEMGMNDWQLGFYDSKKDKITTFVITGDNIKIRPEEEIFKKEEAKVNEINLGKVRLTFDNAIAKAAEFQGKKYPKDRTMKTIAILQNIENLGNVWNITYITESFNTLNMKIDASNGKVIEHNLSSILSFRKK